MGLDAYANKVPAGTEYDGETAIEFFYWHKNNALHGWMAELYSENGGQEACFNQIPVQLHWEDLVQLKMDIENDQLVPTEGFFFGAQDYSSEQKEEDLQFIEQALQEIQNGFDVYYDSWW